MSLPAEFTADELTNLLKSQHGVARNYVYQRTVTTNHLYPSLW